MLKKIKHIWRNVALTCMGLAIIAIGLMSARLLSGPIPIGWAVPWLETALHNTGGIAENLNISDLSLTWNPQRRHVEFTAEHVRLANADQTLTAVERVNLTLSIRAMLLGQLELKDITLVNPHLNLVVGKTETTGTAPPPGFDLGKINALSHLRSVTIEQGQIALLRGPDGLHDTLSNVQMLWRRNEISAAGSFSGMLRMAEDPTPSPLQAELKTNSNGVEIAFSATDIRPDSLQNLLMSVIPEKMPADISLNQIQMPIGFHATLQLDKNNALQFISGDLTTGMGQVIIPDLYDRDVPVENLSLSGRYNFTTQDWQIANLKLSLLDPDAPIPVEFSAEDSHPKNALGFHLKAGNINLSALKRWWPKDVAPGGYIWVKDHIHAGNIANTDINALLTRDEKNELAIKDIKGVWELQGVTTSFLPPFMPVTDVNGIATMDADKIDFAMKYGRINDLEMQNAALTIDGLRAADQTMKLDANLVGQLPNLLALLDTPPFEYAKKYGLSSATARGGVGLRLQFELPLLAALELKDVKYHALANLDQVFLPNVLMGKDIARGTGVFDMDPQHMKIDGAADLAGVSMQFSWQDNAANNDGVTRLVNFNADLLDDDHAKLGLPTAGYVHGPAKLSGSYETKNNQNTLRAKMDLSTAEVAIADLNYAKPAGMPMTIDTSVNMAGATNNLALTATGKTMALDGMGILDANMKPQKLDFGVFRFGDRTNAKVSFEQQGLRERWMVTGQSFDASAMMGRDTKTKPETTSPQTPKWIGMQVASLFLANQSEIKNLRAEMDHDGRHWDKFLLQGDLRPNTPITIAWQPKASGQGQTLSVSTNDAGAALRAFAVTDNIRGGRLTVEGAGNVNAPQWLANGKIILKDFRVTQAPLIAKLVSLSSPGGLIDALKGDGIAFQRLDAAFDYSDNLLHFRDGKIGGNSLGFTFAGDIYHSKNPNTLALTGTIVPISMLNTAIDQIPLVGNLLNGKNGLLAFNYKASGPISDPDVNVNPLSALTPGFLRDLLFGNSSDK